MEFTPPFPVTGSLGSSAQGAPTIRLPIGSAPLQQRRRELPLLSLGPAVGDGIRGGQRDSTGPRMPPSAEGLAAGTSSFGMSGVNAHAIVCLPHGDPISGGQPMAEGATEFSHLVWIRRDLRRPVIPIGHPLLYTARLAPRPATSVVEFSVHLAASARLSWLRDHVVIAAERSRAGEKLPPGMAIVPGAAFLEMAVAAARATLIPTHQASDPMLGLADVSFISPCAIPMAAQAQVVGDEEGSAMLIAELDVGSGAVTIWSSLAHSQHRLHQRGLNKGSHHHQVCGWDREIGPHEEAK